MSANLNEMWQFVANNMEGLSEIFFLKAFIQGQINDSLPRQFSQPCLSVVLIFMDHCFPGYKLKVTLL